MAATPFAFDPPPTDFGRRLDRLEWQMQQQEQRSVQTAERVVKVETTTQENTGEIREARSDVAELKSTLNRLTWAIVTLTLTIAGGAIALALQIASSGSTP